MMNRREFFRASAAATAAVSLAPPAPGDSRLAVTVLHAVDFGLGPQAAVDAPRVHCQSQQTYVDPCVPPEVRDGLARLGHDVVVQGETHGGYPYGRVNAILIGKDGVMRAGTGPSWGTAAAAC
jgi:gamma-glutamyltranspeptidase